MLLPLCGSRGHHCEDQRGLETRAASSLCELSDHICAEAETQRRHPQQQKTSCSPWKPKKEHFRREPLPDQPRRRALQQQNHSSHSHHQSILTEEKENLPPGGSEELCQNRLRKFPSVFARLMAARQARNALPKDKEETEIFAILRKKETHSQIKKIALRERSHNFSLNAKRANEEPPIASRSRTVKLARSEEEMAEESRVAESWKAKQVGVKGWAKRPAQHESVPLPRKGTISLQRKYNEQYQSRNPLTKLLYEKLINTISMTSSAKEGRYRLIVNAFIN